MLNEITCFLHFGQKADPCGVVIRHT